ncbi:MAG: single-stranded DNA-binding protein [Bacteroidetes Order II. Incertae sedis bacterium]|nr:single-stranded DNA-binding protein [Bacteroidetes Order II. bacterium]
MARNSLNRVMLIGNLAADPQTRATGNGVTITNFTVMTNEGYRDANGNLVERSEAHRIVVFDKLADICAKYLTKGRKVYIEGSLQTRSYDDKDGIKRYTTEIKANEMLMLDRGNNEAGAGNFQSGPSSYNTAQSSYGGGGYQTSGGYQAPQRVATPPPPPQDDDFGPDDDLPF